MPVLRWIAQVCRVCFLGRKKRSRGSRGIPFSECLFLFLFLESVLEKLTHFLLVDRFAGFILL
jgi:hypothetical protein